jgi:toxin FitB
MILLETIVLSALMRQSVDVRVVEWLDRQPRNSSRTTAVKILGIRFGIQILARAKRRSVLLELFEEPFVERSKYGRLGSIRLPPDTATT